MVSNFCSLQLISVNGKKNPKNAISRLIGENNFIGDNINGIELVTGYKQDFDITNSGEGQKTNMERYDPNIFALNAFIASIIGIFLFVVKKFRSGYLLQAIISGIGFICMLGLMIDLKSKLADAQNGGNGKLNFDLNLEFEMKFGYWLVTACFLVATIINIVLSREKKEDTTILFPEVPNDLNNRNK